MVFSFGKHYLFRRKTSSFPEQNIIFSQAKHDLFFCKTKKFRFALKFRTRKTAQKEQTPLGGFLLSSEFFSPIC